MASIMSLKTGKESMLDMLPDEVLLNIFSYLYAIELVAIQSTNKRFRQFIKVFFLNTLSTKNIAIKLMITQKVIGLA